MAITDHSFGRDERGTLEKRIRDICIEADRFNRPGEITRSNYSEGNYMNEAYTDNVGLWNEWKKYLAFLKEKLEEYKQKQNK